MEVQGSHKIGAPTPLPGYGLNCVFRRVDVAWRKLGILAYSQPPRTAPASVYSIGNITYLRGKCRQKLILRWFRFQGCWFLGNRGSTGWDRRETRIWRISIYKFFSFDIFNFYCIVSSYRWSGGGKQKCQAPQCIFQRLNTTSRVASTSCDARSWLHKLTRSKLAAIYFYIW